MHIPERNTFFSDPVVMTGTWRAHSCLVASSMMVLSTSLTVRAFVVDAQHCPSYASMRG